MSAWLGEIIGGALGIWGADKAAQAAEDAARQQLALQEQGLKGGLAVAEWLTGQVGKPSPTLAAAHQRNVAQLGREQQAAQAEAARRFLVTGGSGAGEATRIGTQYRRAAGEETLSYAGAQDQYRQSVANAALNAMLGVGSGTNVAASLMSGAYGAQGRARSDYWSSIAGLGLQTAGTLWGDQEWRAMLKAAGKKNSQGTGTFRGVAPTPYLWEGS